MANQLLMSLSVWVSHWDFELLVIEMNNCLTLPPESLKVSSIELLNFLSSNHSSVLYLGILSNWPCSTINWKVVAITLASPSNASSPSSGSLGFFHHDFPLKELLLFSRCWIFLPLEVISHCGHQFHCWAKFHLPRFVPCLGRLDDWNESCTCLNE